MNTEDSRTLRVPAGEGEKLWVLGDLYEFKAGGDDTGEAFALFETTATPGLPGPPMHVHHREDESFYVLEGEMEVTVNGETAMAVAGTFFHIPRGTPHTFKNAGEVPARFLGLVAPAGLERFFGEIGEPVVDGGEPPSGPPDIEKVLMTAPKYGLEILPPPS